MEVWQCHDKQQGRRHEMSEQKLNKTNSLPQNPDFKQPSERGLLKTFWKKEKMLVTSIFSFSHNDFFSSQNKFQHLSYFSFVICKCFQLDLSKILFFGNGLSASMVSILCQYSKWPSKQQNWNAQTETKQNFHTPAAGRQSPYRKWMTR